MKQEAKQKQEEKPFTAWGEEQPGGVQVGLGYLPGEKRVYSTGESVTLVVRAKNVGKKEVNLEYVRDLWINFPPAITNGDGKKYALPKVRTNIMLIPTQAAALKAGAETELYRMKLDLRPASEADEKQVMKVFGTGKFQIQEEYGLIGRVWVGQDRAIATDRTLASGKLDLEVTDKPPLAEKKPLGISAKPEARKVYTPDELVREKYDAVATRTVEFKVVVVAKPTPIRQSPEQGAPWIIGHGPEDVSLFPYPPKKVDEREFSVILTSKVVDQLKRIGIKDAGKHFGGKTIRVSGRIHQHRYISDDPPEEPHYDLVIEDVSQIEAVE